MPFLKTNKMSNNEFANTKYFVKYNISPENRSESMMMNRIRDFKFGWVKINNSHREFRIGVQTNCNGEICKNIVNHERTKQEIINFFDKLNIKNYLLKTIDTDFEYSNQITLENNEYENLSKQILVQI